MRAQEAIKQNWGKALRVLKVRLGVKAEVYFPERFLNPQHGYLDENVVYKKNPLSVRVLIPSLFRMGEGSLETIDPFYNADQVTLYESQDVIYPCYSKIVLRIKGVVKNYIINEVIVIEDEEAQDTGRVIYRKYLLIPSVSFDIERNRSELVEVLNSEERPLSEVVEPLSDSLTVQVPEPYLRNNYINSPIKKG